MIEWEILKNYICDNDIDNIKENIKKIIFYTKSNTEIINIIPEYLEGEYLNNLNIIIDLLKNKQKNNIDTTLTSKIHKNIFEINDISTLIEIQIEKQTYVLIKIFEILQLLFDFIILKEAHYLIILNNNKCIIKLKNTNINKSNISVCIDIKEFLILISNSLNINYLV